MWILTGYPIDILKTRMQIGFKGNALTQFKGIITNEGVTSLFRGSNSEYDDRNVFTLNWSDALGFAILYIV